MESMQCRRRLKRELQEEASSVNGLGYDQEETPKLVDTLASTRNLHHAGISAANGTVFMITHIFPCLVFPCSYDGIDATEYKFKLKLEV